MSLTTILPSLFLLEFSLQDIGGCDVGLEGTLAETAKVLSPIKKKHSPLKKLSSSQLTVVRHSVYP